MDRDEILAKSREENKERDLYKAEIEAKAGTAGMLTVTFLALLFAAMQLFFGKEINYGLYALLFSVGAAQFVVKAVHQKRLGYIVAAVAYIAATLIYVYLHFRGLLAG